VLYHTTVALLVQFHWSFDCRLYTLYNNRYGVCWSVIYCFHVAVRGQLYLLGY